MAARHSGRYPLIDVLRGLAIIAMVVFHIAWDLYYFGLSTVDVTTAPFWVGFQKAILTSFLLLVGAGLVLGHGDGIRWGAFWRRFGILVGAALLVSGGTYLMFPDYFVFFGVLHAIALFSLLALPFLFLPAPLVLLAGIGLVLVSFSFTDPAFTERQLAWIGFWPVSPPTSDVVPVFPWFGVVLLGMAAMRGILASAWARGWLEMQSDAVIFQGLRSIGRWSLPIYLLHQPLLIGIVLGLLQLQSPVLMPPVA